MTGIVFDLADRIRKAREMHGWDIGEMAERLGISRNSVSGWERRKHTPHPLVLKHIAQVTGVTLTWLISGEDVDPGDQDDHKTPVLDSVSERHIPTWTMADRMRKARIDARYTAEDMCNLIGISRKSVTNYEQGDTRPLRSIAAAWADVTGTYVEWLRDGPPT